MTTMDYAPAPDPTKARNVTLEVRLGQEALDMLLTAGGVPPGPRGAQLQLLAVAFVTLCQELVDEQRKPLDLGTEQTPHVPNQRRVADLKIAGRQAAIAITQIELALGIALKAAARVG